MSIVNVHVLNGIHMEFQPLLYQAMKSCNNRERLAVCLFFMSDLPDESHSLSRIENELMKIFPPSLPRGYIPETYKDFSASAIRFNFNSETTEVKSGNLLERNRLWQNTEFGCWRNTTVGNSVARHTLKKCGITIIKNKNVLNP